MPSNGRATPKLLRNHVYQRIKQDIISGVYASGEPLPPNHLAKRYRVSLTPVREAFHALQKDGLIEIIPASRLFCRIGDRQRYTRYFFIAGDY